jgi:hypothetical protein
MNFIKGLLFLGTIIGQIYICEFTNLNYALCYLLAIPEAFIIAFIMSELKLVHLFKKSDDADYTLLFQTFIFMLAILTLTTIGGLSER